MKRKEAVRLMVRNSTKRHGFCDILKSSGGEKGNVSYSVESSYQTWSDSQSQVSFRLISESPVDLHVAYNYLVLSCA